jgi:hypothetical protein
LSEKPGYRKLNHYKAEGFVFHGSIRQGLRVLLPQKPRDAGDDPWNKDEAVYATIEPGLAIPFSLRKGYTGVLTVAKPDKVMATFDAAFESALLKNRGYVYVLDGSCFPERKGVQCKAFEEVVPVDIVEVTVEDFTALGGLIVYVNQASR